jgi:tripartite-type tricarboxylate transporter receptor subunit TctC
MNAKKMLIGVMAIVSFFYGFECRATAAEYPSKPINLIICHPPGGSADVVGRPLANAASKYLGQPIILENKGGGGGTAGPQWVAKRAPDGYTIGVMLNSTLIAYHMGKLNFNPITDLTCIMTYASTLQGIVVRADSPWKTLSDLIEYSKKNPGKVSYTSSGFGTTAHIPIENLAVAAGGIKWVHIPSNGGAEMVPALLGGHVDFMSGSSANWMGLVLAGQFRILATYGSKRSSRFPQIPTIQEIGYDVVERNSHTLIGPKGIAKPVVQKVYDAFKRAQNDPGYMGVLKNLDMDSIQMTQEETGRAVKRDFENYGFILGKLGMKGK